MVTLNPDAGTVDMHQLTQMVAAPPEDQLAATIAEVVGRLWGLTGAVDATQPDSWPTWERLDPHVDHLYGSVEQPDEDLLRVVNRLATSRQHRGLNRDAIPLFERARADCERLLGDDHSITITARANLGLSYWQAGRTSEAITLQEAVLTDRQRILGNDHPRTILALANLAVSYKDVGRTPEALELLTRSVADSRRVLGDDHPDTIARSQALEQWRTEG